jgi:hypothetical protein
MGTSIEAKHTQKMTMLHAVAAGAATQIIASEYNQRATPENLSMLPVLVDDYNAGLADDLARAQANAAAMHLATGTYLTGKIPDSIARPATPIDPRRRCPAPLGGAFGRPGRRARSKVPAKMRFLLKMSAARLMFTEVAMKQHHTCNDCNKTGPDVQRTTCPYDSEINDVQTPVTLCPACYQNRADDV